jgi:hypothetical protein
MNSLRRRAMNSLRQLEERGQSVWIDYIRRKMIAAGELKRLVEDDRETKLDLPVSAPVECPAPQKLRPPI